MHFKVNDPRVSKEVGATEAAATLVTPTGKEVPTKEGEEITR
jgi:hypothetical protein